MLEFFFLILSIQAFCTYTTPTSLQENMLYDDDGGENDDATMYS